MTEKEQTRIFEEWLEFHKGLLFKVLRHFGVFQLFFPPAVAMLLNQPPSLFKILLRRHPRILFFIHPSAFILHPSKEPRLVEMNVGEEQGHRAAGRDLPGFVQVAMRALGAAAATGGETPLPRAGEQRAREVVCRAGAADAGNGRLEG